MANRFGIFTSLGDYLHKFIYGTVSSWDISSQSNAGMVAMKGALNNAPKRETLRFLQA